jgi:hypothetical protein
VPANTLTIYSDSQAALKAIAKANPMSSQNLLCRIYTAIDSLTGRGIPIRLQWIPSHRDIAGNEAADRLAKEAALITGPYEKPLKRYLSVVSSIIKRQLDQLWQTRWEHCTKGRHSYHLTPRPTPAIRTLHAGVTKGHSAIIIQLRTGKVGFNAFLYNRRVPGILSPPCECGLGAMTVRHILLVCPKWRDLRQRYLAQLRTTDIRKLLNTPKGTKAVVQFTLATDLLPQFQRTAREEQEKRNGEERSTS